MPLLRYATFVVLRTQKQITEYRETSYWSVIKHIFIGCMKKWEAFWAIDRKCIFNWKPPGYFLQDLVY